MDQVRLIGLCPEGRGHGPSCAVCVCECAFKESAFTTPNHDLRVRLCTGLRFRAVWEKGLGNTPGTQEGMEWERPQERPRSFGVFVQACWPTMKHSEGMCGARSEEGWTFTSIIERSYFLERAPSTILCKPRATILMASNEPTVLPRRPRCKKSSQQKWSGYAPAWLPVALGGAGIANSDLMLHRQVPRVNVGLNKRLDRFGDHKLRLGSPKRTRLCIASMCGAQSVQMVLTLFRILVLIFPLELFSLHVPFGALF